MPSRLTVNHLPDESTNHLKHLPSLIAQLRADTPEHGSENPLFVVSPFHGITRELIKSANSLEGASATPHLIHEALRDPITTFREKIAECLHLTEYKQQAMEKLGAAQIRAIEDIVLKLEKSPSKDEKPLPQQIRDIVLQFGETVTAEIIATFLDQEGLNTTAVTPINYESDQELSQTDLYRLRQNRLAETIAPYRPQIIKGQTTIILPSHKDWLRPHIYTDSTAIDVTVALQDYLKLTTHRTTLWHMPDPAQNTWTHTQSQCIVPYINPNALNLMRRQFIGRPTRLE